MSFGSRARFAAEAERELAREAARVSRPDDVVIVKLKGTARRTLEAARMPRAMAARAAAPQGMLAALLANGIVTDAEPVFDVAAAAGAAELAGAPRGTLAAAARAARGPQPPSARVARRAQGLTSLKVDPGRNAAQLARDLMADPDVEYAYVPAVKHSLPAARRAKATGPDPLAARQWSHGAVQIHEARKRRGFKEATAVTVAIVDSGVDRKHPDLAASISHFENFLAPGEDDRDYQGHGTHVAGIVAAIINNNLGIAGLCQAKLAVLKGLPRKGRPWNATAYYRALARPLEIGARVVNLSLGGSIDPGERDIVLDLLDGGVVVVAAMGNEFEEGNPKSYPAAYDGVIAVGATDEVDRRASFSCTGPHISLVAPGERILSTVPRYPSELADTTLYDSWPGTSMAAPHVAAAAALLLAKKPKLTPAQVRTRLTKTADKVKWQSQRFDDEYGWGRLNIARALR
jgi:hypothetical protein